MSRSNLFLAAAVAALLALPGCATGPAKAGATPEARQPSLVTHERERDAAVLRIRTALDRWDGQAPTLAGIGGELSELQKQFPDFAPIYVEYARYQLRAGYIGGHGYRTGTLATAHQLLGRAISLAPKYPGSYPLLAQVYFDTGAPKAAARVLERAEALKAHGPWLDVVHGELLQRRGDLDGAERRYRAALAVQPIDRMAQVMAYGGLLAIAGNHGDRAACDRAYQGLVKAELNNPWDRNGYATILLYAFGDIDGAIRCAEEARKLSDAALVQGLLAEALYAKWAVTRHTDAKAAQGYFDRARALQPELGPVLARAGANRRLYPLVVALKARGVPLESKDEAGNTALVTAVQTGRADAVSALLALGAAPDGPGAGGATPLMVAAAQGRDDLVRMLLKAGAKVESQDLRHRTALWYAANGGALVVAGTLLEKGAKPNGGSHAELTPLMLAAGSGNMALVKLLLQHGADPRRQYDGQHDAVDIAMLNGHQEIAALLREAKAR